ncbi:MAG TPA: hypothetical protein VE261_06735 [Gaiellaceae bacterium]|nr:hypothetical protein [Gaiellaceae bacterium]
MNLLSWWRRRKAEQEREAESVEEMRRAGETEPEEPKEVKLSQLRD